MDSLDVSVIICSRNRSEMVLKAIESVVSGTRPPLEIIVVDQSDVPNHRAITVARAGKVRYFWSEAKGASHARNTGIRLARGTMLAFIDDDVVVHKHWLEELIRPLIDATDRTVVTGKVFSSSCEADGAFAPSTTQEEASRVSAGQLGKDVLYSGNMALYRSAIENVGLFDERLGPGTDFPAAEDNDFGRRLLRAGYHIRFVPQAAVDHLAWRSRREFLPLRWRYGKGQGAFYAKHLALRDPRVALRLLRDLTRPLVSSTLRFWRSDRFGGAAFSAGVAVGCVQWLVRERPEQSPIPRTSTTGIPE